MRPLTRPAVSAAILALLVSLVPVLPASAALPSPPAGGVELSAVQFTDATHGWAVGGFQSAGQDYAVVERTTDGGVTWTRSTVLGQPTSHKFHSISMTGNTVGYAADDASWNRVFKTTDGGVTWSPLVLTTDFLDPNNVLASVRFFDATHGYAAGRNLGNKNGVVWATSDGGTTWTRAYQGPQTFTAEGFPTGDNQFRAVSGPSPSSAVVVGVDLASATTGTGTAYRYAGSAWATQTVPAGATLESVSYPDPTHALAVGAGARAVKFDGSSWTAVPTGLTAAYDLEDVALVDPTHGWAVGSGGSIRFWNGSSFAGQTSGTAVRLRGVWFTDASKGWAVGDNDVVLKTIDGGAHWTLRSTPVKTYENIEGPAGGTRFDTAIAAVEKAFPAGSGTVVLAWGRNFPDALGAS
ncbi:MAG TPA: YCF48-related protein, partial [Coriobacteriia bacterium]